MPEDPTPLNNLGMVMEAAGKGFEALELYHQAYELDPLNPLYLGNLVRTRIRLGDNDELAAAQLKELLFIETRPEWVAWINQQLAIDLNPYLDRGPAPQSLEPDKKKAKPENPETSAEQGEVWEVQPEANGVEFSPEFSGESILLEPAHPMVEIELEEIPPPDQSSE